MSVESNVPTQFGVIIGAMKGGSTSLFDYLAAHPEVCGSAIKETNYFSNDEFKDEDLTAYHELWPNWNPTRHKVAIEASVNYTKFPSRPNVAERISRFDADWKFIYVLRNPLDRIESHLTHGQARSWNASDVDEHHIICSMYAKQLDLYVERFSRESIHLLTSEALRTNRAASLESVREFLGLSLPFSEAQYSTISNSWTKHRIDHPLIQWARKRRVLGSVAKLVPVGARRLLRQKTGTPAPRVKLDNSSRELLIRKLRPDLQRLRDQYGVDAKKEWGIVI